MTDATSPMHDLLNRPGGLAARLRAMLDESGMNGREFAARTGLSTSKISKVKLGQQVPSSDDIATWATACDRAGEIDELTSLADAVNSEHRAWKQRLRGGGHAAEQDTLVPLDESSARIRVFQNWTVPGPLQTADFARAMFTLLTDLRELVDNDIEAAVAKRMDRQRLLHAPGKSWEFLIDESVLLRPMFALPVMLSQLDRFQTVIGAPNIRFGVLPLDRALPAPPMHAFTLFDDVGLVEGFVGQTRHEGDGAVFLHKVLDGFWERAVEGDDARDVLARAVARLRGLET
jgi:transcriptional regulator with XRE-family HTH domain